MKAECGDGEKQPSNKSYTSRNTMCKRRNHDANTCEGTRKPRKTEKMREKQSGLKKITLENRQYLP
jgi:hypothetical protein